MRYEDQLMDEADWYNEQSLQVDTLKETIKTQQVEIEALKVNAGNMSQDKERDIIQRDERIFELETEIEALKIDFQNLQNQLMIEGHEADCACVTASSIDCSCGSRDKLLGLLRQWRDKANDGLIDDTFNGMRSPELEQLITDTKTVLGE